MAWNQTLDNLRDTLADLYPTREFSVELLRRAQVPTGRIPFSAAAYSNWFSILDYADKAGMVRDIVEKAHQDWPGNEVLKRYVEVGNLPALRGPDIRDDIDWKAPSQTDILEKIMGRESTLLPIGFLETGLERARAVGRIVRGDGAMGTGFVTDGNLLITNHHVLPDDTEAQNAQVQFNYQHSSTGLVLPGKEYSLAPQVAFATCEDDDWTVVNVKDYAAGELGTIGLRRTDIEKNGYVNIIQHPMGGPKQIALYHNIVVYVGHNRIQYLTDTLPGSSGSPVFDSNWNVVALHHSGGYLREPGSKQAYYRNEGILINAVIDGMMRAGLRPE
ncbi:MAG: trypsin-like peptidase domain-containing protein [Anaerolineae bacterium]|nr:trypsin-like peptidase domain-containing protein [Anaerolineae bacterium]